MICSVMRRDEYQKGSYGRKISRLRKKKTSKESLQRVDRIPPSSSLRVSIVECTRFCAKRAACKIFWYTYT